MNKKLIGSVVCLVALVVAFNLNLLSKSSNSISGLGLLTIEALASENGNGENDGGSSKWFSNLNWTSCTTVKFNGAAAFYYKGIFIPAYGSYTLFGNKKVCERELSINTCHTSNQTPCS